MIKKEQGLYNYDFIELVSSMYKKQNLNLEDFLDSNEFYIICDVYKIRPKTIEYANHLIKIFEYNNAIPIRKLKEINQILKQNNADWEDFLLH